jgi:hypothetical protein
MHAGGLRKEELRGISGVHFLLYGYEISSPLKGMWSRYGHGHRFRQGREHHLG